MGFTSLRSWALLCLSQLSSLTLATTTIYIPECDSTLAINTPKGTEDVNFYMEVPDIYQYVAFSLGQTHDNALMFIAYPLKSESSRVKVTARLSTGTTEPAFYPDALLYIPEARHHNGTMIINATCTHGCRKWPGGGDIELLNPAHGFSIALGPIGYPPSDSSTAPLRRHIGIGTFGLDMLRASNASWLTLPPTPRTSSEGVHTSGDTVIQSDNPREKASTAHGVVFTIVALLIAPFDTLVAGALKRWPLVHTVTSTVYLAMTIGALVPGIRISKRYILTERYRTPHQVLGSLTVGLMVSLAVWGVVLMVVRRVKGEGEDKKSGGVLGRLHKYVGWLVWLLLVVNVGLGLKLAHRARIFLIGYGAMVGAVIVFMAPVYFLAWRCTRPKKKEEEPKYGGVNGHEMNNLYDHNYENYR